MTSDSNFTSITAFFLAKLGILENDDTRFSLIEKVKSQGDEAAWELFACTYKQYIKAVILKLGVTNAEVHDMEQDILLKLWKKLPNFDYQPNKGRFRTWLYSVIRNHIYDYYKSKRVRNSNQNTSIDAIAELSVDSKMQNIMDSEWKAYVSGIAMQRIEKNISAQNIEIFNRLMKGETPTSLANEFGVKPNSISKIKNRIKERLIVEIAELRKELE